MGIACPAPSNPLVKVTAVHTYSVSHDGAAGAAAGSVSQQSLPRMSPQHSPRALQHIEHTAAEASGAVAPASVADGEASPHYALPPIRISPEFLHMMRGSPMSAESEPFVPITSVASSPMAATSSGPGTSFTFLDASAGASLKSEAFRVGLECMPTRRHGGGNASAQLCVEQHSKERDRRTSVEDDAADIATTTPPVGATPFATRRRTSLLSLWSSGVSSSRNEWSATPSGQLVCFVEGARNVPTAPRAITPLFAM
jgi:hypothetical protein